MIFSGGDFLFREAALWADGQGQSLRWWKNHRSQIVGRIGMGQDSDRGKIGSAGVVLPLRERRHLHEHVSAALFTGFNHTALHLLKPRLSWMDDAARGAEWDKSGDAQLRELLQEKLGAIAFGKRSGHLQV